MRIVNFTNSYKPTIGGIETSIALFRQGLITAGHDVHVIAPERKNYIDREPYVFRVPSIELPDDLADGAIGLAAKTLLNITVHGIKPDIIHSQHPFLFGGAAADFAREMAVPLVYTFHTRYDTYVRSYVPILPKLAGQIANELISSYLRKCDHIIAPTPGIRNFILSEYVHHIPVTVVPTPVDLSAYRQLEPQRIRHHLGLAEAELLLCVTRLFPEKNLPFLLRTFARIAAQRAKARLLLVGEGPERESLSELARSLRLEDRVIFSGAAPHDEIPHFAAAADLFFFASQAETQGLVLVEAMAAGTPVVALEASGVADVLAAGGGIITPDREEALAEATVALLADQARRQALGEAARAIAQRYAIPEATRQLVEVYERAIDDYQP